MNQKIDFNRMPLEAVISIFSGCFYRGFIIEGCNIGFSVNHHKKKPHAGSVRRIENYQGLGFLLPLQCFSKVTNAFPY